MVRNQPDQEDDPVLRAKYLDWCSARVAERFVKLTPEEIYTLAEQANSASARPAGAPAGAAAVAVDVSPASAKPIHGEASPSFRSVVERVTEVLAAELALPAFDDWAEAYRKDPSKFDDELLGLWREQL